MSVGATTARTTSNDRASANAWADLIALNAVLGRRLRGAVAALAARHGLSEAQFSLLWHCRRAPASGLSQQELATDLALSAAQVSAQVEQLRLVGWLVGARDSNDRRRQCWRLTPAGHAVAARVAGDLATWAAKSSFPLDQSLAPALDRLLGSVAGAASHLAAPNLSVVHEDEPASSPRPAEDAP